jgi:hypothetical protein
MNTGPKKGPVKNLMEVGYENVESESVQISLKRMFPRYKIGLCIIILSEFLGERLQEKGIITYCKTRNKHFFRAKLV